MILSNVEIHRALDEKRLRIEPEPLPRFRGDGVDCPYQTTAVDLRLGDEISQFKAKLPFDINLNRGSFVNLFGPNSTTVTIAADTPFILKPHCFVLAKTFEKVSLELMPAGQVSLSARVEGKSSYARCGLLVHFTAPTIHAGFSGTITLELINLGPCNISLYPHTAICQLIFEEVAGVPIRIDSQFQGQTTPGGRVNS